MEKLKLAAWFIGVGVVIGVVVALILTQVFGAQPSGVSLGPIEFDIPAPTSAIHATTPVRHPPSTQAVPTIPTTTLTSQDTAVAPTHSSGPFREHRTASVGTGPFAQVTYSDGGAPFSQDELDTRYFHIQRIRLEENPDGCGVSVYDTDRVWFSGSANTVFTLNGQEAGRLSVDTGNHGYVANWAVHVGDELCAVGFMPSGFHIIIGPDMYCHYDSYCYRGYCQIGSDAQ